MAGSILTEEAFKNRVNILPVDSEHSAIFQALGNNKREFIKRLILTASGGPLLKLSQDQLNKVTIEMALNHPTWKMGKKISIDSATLMNKGFEVIEAKWLFGVPPDKISVWIHPQSIVHSMVEYIDGSIIAQMSVPDMKIPIAYALSYPERIPLNLNRETSINSFKELTFEEASFSRFPALKLAYKAAEEGGTVPAVMNAANEVAVEAFLQGKIRFTDIIRIVSKVMEVHKPLPGNTLEEILEMDSWARKTAKALIS